MFFLSRRHSTPPRVLLHAQRRARRHAGRPRSPRRLLASRLLLFGYVCALKPCLGLIASHALANAPLTTPSSTVTEASAPPSSPPNVCTRISPKRLLRVGSDHRLSASFLAFIKVHKFGALQQALYSKVIAFDFRNLFGDYLMKHASKLLLLALLR